MLELRWKKVDPVYPNSIDLNDKYAVLQYRQTEYKSRFNEKTHVFERESVKFTEWQDVPIE